MPDGFVRTLVYAFVLWIVGFVWGVIVFTIPALKNIPSAAHISKLPAVSAVLIPAYAVILYFLASVHLKGTTIRAIGGLKFGLWLAVPNVILDVLIYVILFASFDYFSYLSIWVAYALFLIIPALVGRGTRSA